MRIMIVSDAWEPQVNGVVRTLQATQAALLAMGHEVAMITPDLYRSVPCPTYPEIRLAVGGRGLSVGQRIADFVPDAIHLSTEGPLCLGARRWCIRHRLAFTTAYHTQFPAYVAARTGLPERLMWRYIRWFHAPARAVLTSTASIRTELQGQGITHLSHWGRGVDLALFRPDRTPHPALTHLPRPIQLYVGRVSVEKNIEAFLRSDVPGTKVIIGDGPARAQLSSMYPDTHFLGAMTGEDLAAAYAGADVFVFPSRTDTFGLVLIEALASGTPVAAYPVTGPRDIVTPAAGVLDENLDAAIVGALTCSRTAAAALGQAYSWEAATAQFVAALAPAHVQMLADAV